MLALARKRGNVEDITRLLALLASFHSHRGEDRKALPYIEEWSKITEKLKQRELHQLTLYGLADTYERLGRYMDAVAAYEKSLKLVPEDGNLAARTELLDGLSRIHAFNGNYPKAAERSMELLRLVEKSGSRGEKNRVRENLSEIYEGWARSDPENRDLKKLKALPGK
jgi:tetratricopeptide (TPR) repeat protein